MKMSPRLRYRFEVRQIDAWASPEGWYYNNVFRMGTFMTRAKDERKAFTGHLRRKFGIVFKKNKTRIEFDGDNYTIIDRKTKAPLFDAIFIGEVPDEY